MIEGTLISPQVGVVIAVAAAGGLMRGFAGFGSGMLMAPILSVLYSPVTAVTIIVLLESVATVQLIPQIRLKANWRLVALMASFAIVFMPLGGWLLMSLTPAFMTQAISFIGLACVALIASGWTYHGPRRAVTTASVGILSGIMMGATSLGMPPVMAYLFSGGDSAAESRRNITAYFALTLFAMLALLVIGGLLQKNTLVLAILLAPLYIATTWVGSILFHKSNERYYRGTVLALLAFSGLYGLLH